MLVTKNAQSSQIFAHVRLTNNPFFAGFKTSSFSVVLLGTNLWCLIMREGRLSVHRVSALQALIFTYSNLIGMLSRESVCPSIGSTKLEHAMPITLHANGEPLFRSQLQRFCLLSGLQTMAVVLLLPRL